MIEAYEAWLRSGGATPETVRTRRSHVRRWLVLHPDPAQVSEADCVAWLGRPLAPESRKSARASLRSFHRWALHTGLSDHDPTINLPPVRVPRATPRPASEAQVAAGLAASDPDTRLMVGLAAWCGLRRSEIAGLRTTDVTPWGLHVVGKGGRGRTIPVPPLVRALTAGRDPGFVFPSATSSTGHVHPATVQKRVREATGVGPHALRHRFATVAHTASGDLLAVQELLGHESPETTQRYVLVDRDRVRAAASAAW